MSEARLAIAFALAIGLSACGQGDSGNVMGAGANSLTPAQVDAALGSEVANEAGNALDPTAQANDAVAAEAVERPAVAEAAPRRPPPPPARSEEPDEPEDHSGHDMTSNTTSNEQ